LKYQRQAELLEKKEKEKKRAGSRQATEEEVVYQTKEV